MKKIAIALVSAAVLGVLGGVVNAAWARGGDDLCGGCPKDFKCAIVVGVPQCVPEDGAAR